MKRMYQTRVKTSSNYILGRINDCMVGICSMDPEDRKRKKLDCSKGKVVLSICTDEKRYQKFKDQVELLYPKTCKFDFQEP